jgi:outer membrane protein
MSSNSARIIAITLLAAPISAFAQQPRPVSLDEAVRLAQRSAPAAVQALGAVRAGRAAVASSLSQFLPSLSVNASATKQSGAQYFQGALVPFSGDAWSQGRGYNANLQLFDGGQRYFNYRAASTSLEAGRENEVSQAFGVSLQVKQQYFAVLAARESQAAAERQLEQAQQQMNISTTRVQVGAVARTDSLRSAITVGNARIAILNAQTALDNANAGLTRLVGTPFDVTAVASDTGQVPTVMATREELLAMLPDGPTVRAAEAQLAAAKMSRRATATNYLPTIFASYGFSTGRTSPDFTWGDGPGSRSTRLSLSAGFTLFGGYQREQAFVNATVAEDNAVASLRDAKAASRENLVQYLGAFRSAEEAIRLQSLQVAVATEDLDGGQQRYAAGATSVVDLFTAQTTLANAYAALIQARYNARTAKAQLEALLGRELR